MTRLSRILLWIAGFIILVTVVFYAFGIDYIFKGVRVTYLQGHKTAYLDDYRFFDNHTIKAGHPQPWNEIADNKKVPLSEEMRAYHQEIESVAYLVIKNDTIISEEYFDNYSKDSKSNSFSMAKSMVAAILGKILEERKIKSLDQKIKEFVPEIVGEYANELTFRHLVTMSSGMKWSEDYYSPFSITTQLYFDDDLINVLKKMPIIKKPGQHFIYQSGDTQLLGIAIERATGKSLSELLSIYFWQPMGAENDALWQVDSEKHGIEKAYCCVASNARDFARFGKLYLQNGTWNNKSLISAEYIKMSIKPYFADSPEYGYGWWLGRHEGKEYFHMDGHLGQYVIVIPKDNLIIVRLGHQAGHVSKFEPESSFNHFINQAYTLLSSHPR